GVPADTFAAMGNRGQFVVIVPSMNTVIVRRGEDPPGARFDIAAFTRDVLVSLRD
ncbi:MAG: serine hydrolase, partial [Citromicrobium sp.]|nr:serine hydrolase [Citromicrobium sp.]